MDMFDASRDFNPYRDWLPDSVTTSTGSNTYFFETYTGGLRASNEARYSTTCSINERELERLRELELFIRAEEQRRELRAIAQIDDVEGLL